MRIGDVSEAEDMASEVFARAVRAADSFKETGAPMEAWLFKIARNIVVDHHRKRSRRPSHAPLDDTVTLQTERGNPDESVERQEEIARLRRAMEGLSEAQRQVLCLRFGAELTSQQVAEVMGRKPGAIREMQSAAIRRLLVALAEEG